MNDVFTIKHQKGLSFLLNNFSSDPSVRSSVIEANKVDISSKAEINENLPTKDGYGVTQKSKGSVREETNALTNMSLFKLYRETRGLV